MIHTGCDTTKTHVYCYSVILSYVFYAFNVGFTGEWRETTGWTHITTLTLLTTAGMLRMSRKRHVYPLTKKIGGGIGTSLATAISNVLCGWESGNPPNNQWIRILPERTSPIIFPMKALLSHLNGRIRDKDAGCYRVVSPDARWPWCQVRGDCLVLLPICRWISTPEGIIDQQKVMLVLLCTRFLSDQDTSGSSVADMGPDWGIFFSLSFILLSYFLTFFVIYNVLLPISLFLWNLVFLFSCVCFFVGIAPLVVCIYCIFEMASHGCFYMFYVLFFCWISAFEPGPYIEDNLV